MGLIRRATSYIMDRHLNILCYNVDFEEVAVVIMEIDEAELKLKQDLLAQHRQNLNYLEHQAAQHGPHVPLAIHNAMTAEHEAIQSLERELAATGVSSQPKPQWQALVIDADQHWREIIMNNIGQLGGTVVECPTIPAQEIVDSCAVAIIAASAHAQTDLSASEWVKSVVNLGGSLPIILLTSLDDRETSIRLRHALRNNDKKITATTVFKETFDIHWFSQLIHQVLTH